MNALLENIDRLHTTAMGAERIQRNLSLETEDVVQWCRMQITDPGAVFRREGKNWYVKNGGCVFTVNAYSYTIITAHKARR